VTATENLTAEQALDEVLNRIAFGDWRSYLDCATEAGFPEAYYLAKGVTFGDLRRWSAPLREKE